LLAALSGVNGFAAPNGAPGTQGAAFVGKAPPTSHSDQQFFDPPEPVILSPYNDGRHGVGTDKYADRASYVIPDGFYNAPEPVKFSPHHDGRHGPGAGKYSQATTNNRK